MSVWVLPDIITVEDVLVLDSNVLMLLSKISTGIVTIKINEFISANIESADNNLRIAAEKLQDAYNEVNRTNQYLESQEAKELANTLASLQYSDISATTDLNTLKSYRKMIIELLAEDEDFRNSYTGEIEESATRGLKTAYTTKLDADNLDGIIDNMSEYAIRLGAVERVATNKLINAISKNRSLFKNGSMNTNKATVLRKAIFKKDKLKAILRGLDYLIPRMEAGASPYGWRRL